MQLLCRKGLDLYVLGITLKQCMNRILKNVICKASTKIKRCYLHNDKYIQDMQ